MRVIYHHSTGTRYVTMWRTLLQVHGVKTIKKKVHEYKILQTDKVLEIKTTTYLLCSNDVHLPLYTCLMYFKVMRSICHAINWFHLPLFLIHYCFGWKYNYANKRYLTFYYVLRVYSDTALSISNQYRAYYTNNDRCAAHHLWGILQALLLVTVECHF